MEQLRKLTEERPDEKVCTHATLADVGKYLTVSI
jgi:hypothetical protein